MGIVYDIDVKILEELEKKCFPNSSYTLNQLEEIISDKEKYQILAVNDKNIIKGYIILFDNSESLEIMKIGTLVEYRRQGIGKILIDEISKTTKNIIIDFHAEATSEKIALAKYLDGDISLFYGTHTHVQTADERILNNGTGYISQRSSYYNGKKFLKIIHN